MQRRPSPGPGRHARTASTGAPAGARTGAFDAAAARRAREALALSHGNVAHGMWAAYGIRVDPRTVAAWEQRDGAPDERQLTALAGALWCAPADLLGTPASLREHRLALGLAPADVALAAGLGTGAYEEVERTGRFPGDARQAAALADALGLPLALRLALTGDAEKLAGLLRDAVTARWQGYVRPVGALLPVPRKRLEEALRALHEAYQSATAASLNWGGAGGSSTERDTGEAGRAFLDAILDHFWALLGGDVAEGPAEG